MRFDSVLSNTQKRKPVVIENSSQKRAIWVVVVLVASILSFCAVTLGLGVFIAPFLLVLGAVFPLISLASSKMMAKKNNDIEVLDVNHEEHGSLVNLVNELCHKMGIQTPPEVGIYQSSEINAFATGSSIDDSLIAFSSGLLEELDDDEIAGVAAHELGHIANGDMVTMTICQSIIYSITLALTAPFALIHIMGRATNDKNSDSFRFVGKWGGLVVGSVVLVLGDLAKKAFSRKRELEADLISAKVLGKNCIIKSLTKFSELREDAVTNGKDRYASLKFNVIPDSLGEFFSTHPSIEKRIENINNHFLE